MGKFGKQGKSNAAAAGNRGSRQKKEPVTIEHVVDEGFDPRPAVLGANKLLTHPDIVKVVRRLDEQVPQYLKEKAKRTGRRYVSVLVDDDGKFVKQISVKIPRYHLVKLNLPVTTTNPKREYGPIIDQVQAGNQTYRVVLKQLKKPVPRDERDLPQDNVPIMSNEELSEFLILND
ncbi:hypothetical protein TTRE_0000788701 [Trichuris trichiura]|uniref:Uncharacterized protein n=1 Tax=Trichuris trichiura TaxID=36087 RepID=A0A077ZLL7_TRITR|nr:hypothetical protein TTRE_0000788701 [Trichuris trichiura]